LFINVYTSFLFKKGESEDSMGPKKAGAIKGGAGKGGDGEAKGKEAKGGNAVKVYK
jgi:hypothetical protein